MRSFLSRLTPRHVLGVILALYVMLALAYNIANPILEAPDEILHYDIVRYLQRERELPVVRLDEPLSEYHQPPLYYSAAGLLTAWVPTDDYLDHILRNPFWAYDIGAVGNDNKNQFLHGPDQAFPYQGTPLAIHLIRLFSTVGGALAVYFTYRFVLNLLPEDHALALASAALVAFTPNFILTTAAITNDSFISMAPVALMLTILLLLDQPTPPSPWQWAMLGVLMSLAALVKTSGLPLMPVSAVLAGLLAWRHRSWRVFLTAGLILLGLVLALTGWWFVRNLRLYGDLTGLEQMWRAWGTREPLTYAQYKIEAWNFRTTYWANFGYGNVPVPDLIYRIIDVLMVLGLAGLLWRVLDRLRGKSDRPRLPADKVLLIALWMLITFAALLWYLQRTIQVTGRQIYAITPALSFCLVWGWTRLIPRRWHIGLAISVGVLMFALAVGALVGAIIPAYRPTPVRTAGPERPLDWQIGDVAHLRGVTLTPGDVQPGDTVTVRLYWEALTWPGHNYTVFVHLYGAEGELVGARDTYPGLGNAPTLYWQPGDRLIDTIPVKVSTSAVGPILIEIEAGLYDLETGERLPITDDAGSEIGYPVVGTVKLHGGEHATGEPVYASDTAFASDLILHGYDLSDTEVAGGDRLSVTLYWVPGGPLDADYTVFVHLVDGGGNIAAQADGPPLSGRYPTTAWAASEFFADTHTLSLPAGLSAGDYVLLVGLYNPHDGVRLPLAAGQDHIQLEQGITVR